MRINLLIILLLMLPGLLFTQQQQSITIDQQMVSTAIIKDPELINFFMEAYLIPEENVSELRFIDATGNGFGEEDLINLTPREQTQRVLLPPQQYSTGLILLVSIIIIPGIVVISGIAVWYRRRRRG